MDKNRPNGGLSFNDLRKAELDKGRNGDWQKEGYTITHEKPWTSVKEGEIWPVIAHDKHGNEVGRTSIYRDGDPHGIMSTDTYVHPEHRRKGIATAMYHYAEQQSNAKMVPASEAGPEHLSADGQKLWAQPKRAFGKSLIPGQSYRDLKDSK